MYLCSFAVVRNPLDRFKAQTPFFYFIPLPSPLVYSSLYIVTLSHYILLGDCIFHTKDNRTTRQAYLSCVVPMKQHQDY